MSSSTAAWLIEGAPDGFDTAVGRFACSECADNRDAAELAAMQIAKAHALLRLIRRSEVKPMKSEGLEDDATAQALLGHISAVAVIKARIDLYFDKVGTGK